MPAGDGGQTSAPRMPSGEAGGDSEAGRAGRVPLFVRVGTPIQRFTDWAIVLLFACQFLALVLQVFTRYVMNRPIGWGEELALHLFIWITFLGAAYGTRFVAHPRLTLLEPLEKGRLPGLITFQRVVTIVFLVGLGISGAALAYANRTVLSPTMGISQLFLYGAVPVGAFLIMVEMLLPASTTPTPGSAP